MDHVGDRASGLEDKAEGVKVSDKLMKIHRQMLGELQGTRKSCNLCIMGIGKGGNYHTKVYFRTDFQQNQGEELPHLEK